jgi:hypothetical protein
VTYGSLTVLRRAKPHNGCAMDWVRCSCGSKKFTVRTSHLKAGKVTRCRNRIHDVQDAMAQP